MRSRRSRDRFQRSLQLTSPRLMAEMRDWYAGKRILILGAAGFIGSNLVSVCLHRGAEVTALDSMRRGSDRNEDNLGAYRHRIRTQESRIEDWDGAGDAIAQADLIIDSMGLTAHHVGMRNPSLDLDANLSSHIHLITLLEDAPGKKVIYLGSRGQYGRVKIDVITETTAQVPVDTQGVHKAAAEHLFRIYSDAFGFDVVSLRLANCFGEHQIVSGDDIGLVGAFIRDLLSGKTVDVFGSAQRMKHLLYVADLVEVVLEVGSRPFSGFEAYNVPGESVELGNLLDTLVHLIGRGDFRIRPFPDSVQQLDVGESLVSDEALVNWIGALPRTVLKGALQNTVDYFRRRLL